MPSRIFVFPYILAFFLFTTRASPTPKSRKCLLLTTMWRGSGFYPPPCVLIQTCLPQNVFPLTRFPFHVSMTNSPFRPFSPPGPLFFPEIGLLFPFHLFLDRDPFHGKRCPADHHFPPVPPLSGSSVPFVWSCLAFELPHNAEYLRKYIIFYE